MRHSLIIVCFGLVFCSVSCGSLVRSANGEHRPQNETSASLQVFITENGMPVDLSKCLFLKDKESKLKLSSLRGYDHGYCVAVPNVFVYNEAFWLIDDLKLGGCITTRPEVDGGDFYQSILEANAHVASGFTLDAWKGAFVDRKGNPYFPFERNGKAKVIILWSKYKGTMWANEVNAMAKEVLTSKAPVELFFLNMDEYLLPDS